MPSSRSTPRELHRLSVRAVIQREKSAKGIDSGRLSMIVKGWRKLSNWAASTMYMKMEASRKAITRLRVVSSRIFTEPVKRKLYPAGRPVFRTSSPTARAAASRGKSGRSEEHTSELQPPAHLLCRLLLQKKN